ncbi:Hypothetical predicted protein [Pelobates cultripes]|uniref:Uncharacterized protein n=1 Tax=Pelobates cultripes TaxID=61616 RepID=A0AAD1R267_PELCU|nr:Hypothetical predicted protein [Pelobates cultripes]
MAAATLNAPKPAHLHLNTRVDLLLLKFDSICAQFSGEINARAGIASHGGRCNRLQVGSPWPTQEATPAVRQKKRRLRLTVPRGKPTFWHRRSEPTRQSCHGYPRGIATRRQRESARTSLQKKERRSRGFGSAAGRVEHPEGAPHDSSCPPLQPSRMPYTGVAEAPPTGIG